MAAFRARPRRPRVRAVFDKVRTAGASGYDPHKFDRHPRWHCRTLIKLGYLGAVEPEKPQPKKPTKIKAQKPQTRPATAKPAKKTAKPAAKPANPAQPTKPVAKAPNHAAVFTHLGYCRLLPVDATHVVQSHNPHGGL